MTNKTASPRGHPTTSCSSSSQPSEKKEICSAVVRSVDRSRAGRPLLEAQKKKKGQLTGRGERLKALPDPERLFFSHRVAFFLVNNFTSRLPLFSSSFFLSSAVTQFLLCHSLPFLALLLALSRCSRSWCPHSRALSASES